MTLILHGLRASIRPGAIQLAKPFGLTNAEFQQRCRVSFSKVTEFQARGIIHAHAPDQAGPMGPPLSLPITVEDLNEAVVRAANSVTYDTPALSDGRVLRLHWGGQVDAPTISGGADRDGKRTGERVHPERVASYLAKYLTKVTEDFGLPMRGFSAAHARLSGASDHAVRIIETAEWLAGEAKQFEKLTKYFATLGYGGHPITKSREYSITFRVCAAAAVDLAPGDPLGRGARHGRPERRAALAPSGKAGRPSKSMNLAQAKAVLAACEDSPVGAYVVLGVRNEELRALTWEHVDLAGDPDADPTVPPSVRVWRSVRIGGDTKTKLSRRTIALPAQGVAALEKHRASQMEADVYAPAGLVFVTASGREMDPANIRRAFRAICRKAGLNAEEWTPRELRHSFVSLMSDAGVATEDIARLVGHAGGSKVTETVYRKQLKPVLTTGTHVMESLFDLPENRNIGGDLES